MMAFKALGALDVFGSKVFSPVENDKDSAVKDMKISPSARLLKLRQAKAQPFLYPSRVDSIQELSELSIPRNFRNGKKGFKIARSFLFLQAALKGKQAWILPKHHRQPSHDDINEGKIDFIWLSAIRNI
jgi:hypothetical protein